MSQVDGAAAPHESRRRRGRGPVRALVVLLTVSAMVLGACSGDSDDDTKSGAPSTSATADLPGAPIKVMVIHDHSPDLVEGAEAAAEATNRDGGIADRPLEVLQCDTKDDPSTAAECGRRAVSEGVVAIVGSLTPLSGEFLPTLEQNKIASVGNLPVNGSDFSSPASFPLDGGLLTLSAGIADALYLEGNKTISIARVDLSLASAIQQFANQGLQRDGVKIEADVSVPQGAPDMAPYVAAATEHDEDGLLVGLLGQDATNFLLALRQQKPDVQAGLVTTDLTSLIDVLGDQSDGMVVGSPLLPNTSHAAAVKQYKKDLEAIGVDNSGDYRMNSYAAVKVFVGVAKDLPDVTAPAVYDALPSVNGLDIGLMPPIQFQKGGVGGAPRVFNPCLMYLEIKAGELQPLKNDFIDVFNGKTCSL